MVVDTGMVWSVLHAEITTKGLYCNFSMQNTLYHTCIYNRLHAYKPSGWKHAEDIKAKNLRY
jgi:hypothetical protein